MTDDFPPQEEKEQLIEYRSSVASLVGRAKTVVQLRPRSAESTLGATTPIKAICDYRQIEVWFPPWFINMVFDSRCACFAAIAAWMEGFHSLNL